MRRVTYAMNVSLDGYIAGPDGSIAWGDPDDAVFRYWLDRIRTLGAQLLGRRLYEAMLYWETAEQEGAPLNAAELEWAARWRALPKVVFSSSLTGVQGNARLTAGGPDVLASEVARLRAEQVRGDIAIGGATLAAAAATLALIDEYQAVVHPVLLGGGMPFFPREGSQVALELAETRPIGDQVVLLRYLVRR